MLFATEQTPSTSVHTEGKQHNDVSTPEEPHCEIAKEVNRSPTDVALSLWGHRHRSRSSNNGSYSWNLPLLSVIRARERSCHHHKVLHSPVSHGQLPSASSSHPSDKMEGIWQQLFFCCSSGISLCRSTVRWNHRIALRFCRPGSFRESWAVCDLSRDAILSFHWYRRVAAANNWALRFNCTSSVYPQRTSVQDLHRASVARSVISWSGFDSPQSSLHLWARFSRLRYWAKGFSVCEDPLCFESSWTCGNYIIPICVVVLSGNRQRSSPWYLLPWRSCSFYLSRLIEELSSSCDTFLWVPHRPEHVWACKRFITSGRGSVLGSQASGSDNRWSGEHDRLSSFHGDTAVGGMSAYYLPHMVWCTPTRSYRPWLHFSSNIRLLPPDPHVSRFLPPPSTTPNHLSRLSMPTRLHHEVAVTWYCGHVDLAPPFTDHNLYCAWGHSQLSGS